MPFASFICPVYFSLSSVSKMFHTRNMQFSVWFSVKGHIKLILTTAVKEIYIRMEVGSTSWNFNIQLSIWMYWELSCWVSSYPNNRSWLQQFWHILFIFLGDMYTCLFYINGYLRFVFFLLCISLNDTNRGLFYLSVFFITTLFLSWGEICRGCFSSCHRFAWVGSQSCTRWSRPVT